MTTKYYQDSFVLTVLVVCYHAEHNSLLRDSGGPNVCERT